MNKSKLDSVQQNAIDASFDSSDSYSDGFEVLSKIYGNEGKEDKQVEKNTTIGITETKAIPITLYTDSFTATQVSILLEMIRYCMEKSAEGKNGENKEFKINLRIKNRSNSDFMFSIGDESMPPLANEDEVFIGH